MTRSPIRKLKNGCYAAELLLAPDMMAFAKSRWRALGYSSTADYLNTVLNTALFHEQEAEPSPTDVPARAWPDTENLEFW